MIKFSSFMRPQSHKNVVFNLLLIAIVTAGAILRLGWLSEFPVGFHSSEALLGYRGELLGTTLGDETHRKIPIIFTSLNGYQSPLPSYGVALSVSIFGVREWAVRFPFALAGTLGLIAFYGMTRLIWPGDKSLQFSATLVFAINPWLVFLSRTVSEITFNLHFLLIILLAILYFHKSGLRWLAFIVASVIIMFYGSVAFAYIKAPGAKIDFARNYLGFSSDVAIQNGIDRLRGESEKVGDRVIGRLFFNKSYYLFALTEKSLENLKPQLYFAAGDNDPLHGLSGFGPILIVFLPVLLIGLRSFFGDSFWSKRKILITALFFLAVFPSILGSTQFNQEKAVFAFPLLAILLGYAVKDLRKPWLVVFSIFLAFNIVFVLYDAIFKEPYRAQDAWEYGTKPLAEKLAMYKDKYDRVFISDKYSPDVGIQLLFYLSSVRAYYPFSYRPWVNQIDNITIGQMDRWQVAIGEKVLFVVTPSRQEPVPESWVLEMKDRKWKIVCPRPIEQVFDLRRMPIYLFFDSANCSQEVTR